MAIVNPAHITPYAEIPEEQRQLTEDLIFNRRPDALQRFIEYFQSRRSSPAGRKPQAADPTLGMTPAAAPALAHPAPPQGRRGSGYR